ncbi:hypothetical protein DL98DRAFT_512604 [Cadophora sp. DSE1049]|nr:hypothetical protein DL98DRAFT_512604 [Cadophora sp. DSE1049]
MPSLLDNLGSLLSSIVNGITAIIGSILAVIQSVFNTIFGIIGSAFSAVGTMIAGLAQTFEGVLKFLLSEYPPSKQNIPLPFTDCGSTVWEGDGEGEGGTQTDELIGNILVIGAVIGALFLYGVYQQRNGKAVTQRPAGAKKIN